MLFPPAAECAGLGAYVAERQPRTSRVTLQSRQQFANQSQSPAAAVSRPDLDFFTFDATRDEPALASA
jgi:hypothetical protein